MKRALALACLVALTAEARPRPPRVRKPPASPPPAAVNVKPSATGPGQVTYVGADGAFVDRGSADGVKAGDALQISRNGKAVGRCVVQQVSDHSATCTGSGLAMRDRIGVDRAAPEVAQPLPPLPDARELTARRSQLEAAALPLVEFGAGAPVGSGAGSMVEVSVTHVTGWDLASAQGPYHLERVDAAVRDLKVWRGLHVSADVSVLEWSRRPADYRSPLAGNPQLFVRQAEVSWHEPGGHVTAAVGRIWVLHAPGLSVLDGAQVGARTASGDLEAGVYGGLLPDPVSLGVTTGSWAAGAYGFGRFFHGEGADASWVQPELRAGWAYRAGLGGRFETSAAVHAWVGRSFDVHLMAQGGFGAASALDAVRADVGVRAGERVRVIASGRYTGTPGGELVEVGALLAGTRALHADGQVLFEVSDALVIALNGGAARDFDSHLASGRVGPEVQLPTLLGRGGLAAGYSEELGWIRGRSAYLQATLVPHWRVRVLGRAVWMQYLQGGSSGLAGHELGGSLSLDARLWSWLWFRAAGLLRGRPDGGALAFTLSAQVGGAL